MNTEFNAQKDSFWMRIIAIVSVLICAAIAFLILGPRPEGMEGSLDVSMLPLVNATLNGSCAILLVVALLLIKQKRIEAHKRVMLTAFAVSTLFLISYVLYHGYKSGPKAYEGEYGGLYYFILISHILLATTIVPLALTTLYRGWEMQVERHRKIARITFPIWMYVSVTGVLIYLMLY
jgi:putative membrane protein